MGGRTTDEQSTQAGGFPCWFLLIEALLCLLRVVISFLSLSFLSRSLRNLPVGGVSQRQCDPEGIWRRDGRRHRRAFFLVGGRGWVASFRLLFLIGVFGSSFLMVLLVPEDGTFPRVYRFYCFFPFFLRCLFVFFFCSTSYFS